MTESASYANTVADFREWYQRRQERARSPLERYFLDKCEDAYECSHWESFDYWFEIYRRERRRRPNSNAGHVRNVR
jgi:hypothetical protein